MVSFRIFAFTRPFAVRLTALLFSITVLLAAFAWSMPYDIDELDQIHTAYLYSLGKAPLIHFYDHPLIQSYKWTLGWLIPILGRESIVAYRLLSIIFGIAALGIFALAIKKSLGGKAALAATAFLGISLPFLYRVHQVRSDAMVLFCLALSCMFLSGIPRRRAIPSLIASGIFAGLATAYRVSLIAYPTMVCISILFFCNYPKETKRTKWFLVFFAATALSTAVLLSLPFQLSTVLSLHPLIHAAKIMLLQESALAQSGSWNVAREAWVLLIIVFVGLLGFIFGKFNTATMKNSLMVRSLFLSAPVYTLFLLSRDICLAQDVLFLVFMAAPFVGLLIERMWFGYRPYIKRLAVIFCALGMYALIALNSFFLLGNNYAMSRCHSSVNKEIVCRCFFRNDLSSPMSLKGIRIAFEHNLRQMFGMKTFETPKQIEATKDFFLQTTSETDYCFSSDSSHLFRLNPPSFSPPTLKHHYRWSPSAFDNWIEYADKYYSFYQPIAKRNNCFVWGCNGLSPNDRILMEFENCTPKVILLDVLFLDFVRRYPSLEKFIDENYVAVYHPTAARFFAIHRILGADVIRRWENGEWREEVARSR